MRGLSFVDSDRREQVSASLPRKQTGNLEQLPNDARALKMHLGPIAFHGGWSRFVLMGRIGKRPRGPCRQCPGMLNRKTRGPCTAMRPHTALFHQLIFYP